MELLLIMITTTNQTNSSSNKIDRFSIPDARGRFGPYGGSFVPETLSHPLRELNDAYLAAQKDPSFQQELDFLLQSFAGRPTELYFAERLSKEMGGWVFHSKVDFNNPTPYIKLESSHPESMSEWIERNERNK